MLSEAVLLPHARHYACLGEPFDARRAVEIGLVNAAVPRQDRERATITLPRRLMAKNPDVLRAMKQAIRVVRDMDHQRANEYMRTKMAGAQLRDRDRERARDAGIAQLHRRQELQADQRAREATLLRAAAVERATGPESS